MGKKRKKRDAALSGRLKKQGSEIRHITTFKELDVLCRNKEDLGKGNKFETLYDDFIRKTNKCYSENTKQRY